MGEMLRAGGDWKGVSACVSSRSLKVECGDSKKSIARTEKFQNRDRWKRTVRELTRATKVAPKEKLAGYLLSTPH